MKTYKINNEDGVYVPYKKRLIGWKRLTPGVFPTLYGAVTFLSNSYGTPTIFCGEDHLEITL